MFRKLPIFYCASSSSSSLQKSLQLAQASLATGNPNQALIHLDEVKRIAPTTETADLLRGVAFAQKNDLFAARQSVLEELRHHPQNQEALDIAANLKSKMKPLLALPPEIIEAEPIFAMSYDALIDHTMLDWQRLLSLYQSTRSVILENNNINNNNNSNSNCIVECGVAGGGSLTMMGIAAMHAIEEINNNNNKNNKNKNNNIGKMKMPKLIGCDTFTGMPTPTSQDKIFSSNSSSGSGSGNSNSKISASSSHWAEGTCCSGSEFQIQHLAKAFSLQVETVPGLFEETLPKLFSEDNNENNNNNILMLHIDCDWYESTKQCLEILWPKLQVGGKFQIDDFLYWEGCQKAVEEFFSKLPNPPKCNQAGVALCGTKVG